MPRENNRRRSFGPDLRRRPHPGSVNNVAQPVSHSEHEATGLHPISGNRQDTLESQGSQESHSSDKSTKRLPEPRRRRPSDVDRNKPFTTPVSMMSLPEYRDSKLQLYWPPNRDNSSSSNSNSKLHRVDKFVVEVNPADEFRRFHRHIHTTPKSQIWSVVLFKQDRRQEHVALKLVSCDHAASSKEFKEKIKSEYDLLAELDHKHIIAPVGSFVEEGQPGQGMYGLLLFPLAPYSLRVLLDMISEHNKLRFKSSAEWTRDDRSSHLLNYFACLCQAVIYLHTKPIKHKDIKCENILVDKHGTVILADFDIAKQYTNRTFVVTTGRTEHTAQLPTGHFDKTAAADIGRNVEEFLDMISAMLNVQLRDYQDELLVTAWKCFSKFSTENCPHCYPDEKVHPGLRVPVPSARKTSASTRIDTISEGSSGSSMNGDNVRLTSSKDEDRSKSDQSFERSPELGEGDSGAASADGVLSGATPESPTVPMIPYSPMPGVIGVTDSNEAALTSDPDSPQSNVHGASTTSRERLAPEITFSVPQNERRSAVRLIDQLTSSTSLDATKREEIDVPGVPDSKSNVDTVDESLTSAHETHDARQTSAGAFDEAQREWRRERRPGTPDSHDTDDTDIDIRLRPTHPPRLEATAVDTLIKQNTVRVLTFTPRERRGFSERPPDTIVDTRLLVYENKEFRIVKREHIDQECMYAMAF
ncbi:hypothetical protein Q7P37_003098 [Cladosporium fusiforme]